MLKDSNSSPARIIVQLRDFEGDLGEFPALVGYSGAETWLRGLPEFALPLDDDERLAIAGWAYAPKRG